MKKILSCQHIAECPMTVKEDVNQTIPFDSNMLHVSLELRELESNVEEFTNAGEVSGLNEAAWAIRALMLLDLTTLKGDDTKLHVQRICEAAAHPIAPMLLEAEFDLELVQQVHTAAVCVYPARIKDAIGTLQQLKVNDEIHIVSVATGFPSAQFPLHTRLLEITQALLAGANEITTVISRQLAMVGDWKGIYDEVAAMRRACGERALLKCTIAIGELGSMETIYKAAISCMMGGADFILTSTGMEMVNAILPAGLAIIYAVREYQQQTCQWVGLQPVGNIDTVVQAIAWMKLVKETLGMCWLRPRLFRISAGINLLEDIQRVLVEAIEKAELEWQAANESKAEPVKDECH